VSDKSRNTLPPFSIRSISKSEMALYYKVSTDTMAKWIHKLHDNTPIPNYERNQSILQPIQVQVIVDHIGLPEQPV